MNRASPQESAAAPSQQQMDSGSSRKQKRADSNSSSSSSSSSHLESSVTRLLVATKQLLDGLTQWSVGRYTETQVSDIYVRLGNDFNLACAGFERAGIEMQELYSVPDDLRICLETALSEDASPATLEVHLPKIREIIINLLQGLKVKQQRYRSLRSQERRQLPQSTSESFPPVPSTAAHSGGGSSSSSATQPRRQPSPSPSSQPRHSHPAESRGKSPPHSAPGQSPSVVKDNSDSALHRHRHKSDNQTRPSLDSETDAVSAAGSIASQRRPAGPSSGSQSTVMSRPRPVPHKRDTSATSSVASSTQSQRDFTPSIPTKASSPPLPPVPNESSTPVPPRTVPTPAPTLHFPEETTSSNEPLEALKKSEGLQRRASKRFSSYTFSKMTNSSSGAAANAAQNLAFLDGGEDSIPSKDHSARELVNASRQRSRHTLQKDRRPPLPRAPSSVLDGHSTPQKTTAGDEVPTKNQLSPAMEEDAEDEQSYDGKSIVDESVVSPDDTLLPTVSAGSAEQPDDNKTAAAPAEQTDSVTSPSPSSFPVFLQLGREVKKVHVEARPSTSSLRVLFTEKFQYSPGYADFPAIYLRDSLTGIQYELEDVNEVKENCVLTLNVEPLEEMKSQIDQGLATLTREMKEIKTALSLSSHRSSQVPDSTNPFLSPSPSVPVGLKESSSANRSKASSKVLPSLLSESPALEQQNQFTVKEEKDIKKNTSNKVFTGTMTDITNAVQDIESIRREIGTVKQVYASFTDETRTVLDAARTQAARVREIAHTKVGGARALIDAGKKKLDDRSQNALTRVEALQDTIDDLKADVTGKRIQPKDNQLAQVKEEITATKAELDSVGQLIESVRPEWKRTWQAELQNLVEEQQLLKHQEELHGDLVADHENIVEVFEQIRKYLDLRSAHGRQPREFVVPEKTQDHQGLATVMLQVKSQVSDPDKRLKAIEATERQRVRGLQNRQDEFAKELTGFVDSNKLKRTGGAEETDKIRAMRDERNFKSMFSTAASVSPPSAGQTSSTPTVDASKDIPKKTCL